MFRSVPVLCALAVAVQRLPDAQAGVTLQARKLHVAQVHCNGATVGANGYELDENCDEIGPWYVGIGHSDDGNEGNEGNEGTHEAGQVITSAMDILSSDGPCNGQTVGHNGLELDEHCEEITKWYIRPKHTNDGNEGNEGNEGADEPDPNDGNEGNEGDEGSGPIPDPETPPSPPPTPPPEPATPPSPETAPPSTDGTCNGESVGYNGFPLDENCEEITKWYVRPGHPNDGNEGNEGNEGAGEPDPNDSNEGNEGDEGSAPPPDPNDGDEGNEGDEGDEGSGPMPDPETPPSPPPAPSPEPATPTSPETSPPSTDGPCNGETVGYNGLPLDENCEEITKWYVRPGHANDGNEGNEGNEGAGEPDPNDDNEGNEGDEGSVPAPEPESTSPTPSPTPAPTPDTAPAPAPSPSTETVPEESCPSSGKWGIDEWNLDELLGKIFLFYEAQETGEIRADNRVSWKGDSYLEDSHKGRSLAGGWFDAGDHLKLMFPMGWTISNMAWALVDGKPLLQSTTYNGKTNWEWAVQTLEYGAEFFLSCSFGEGEFVVQVGENVADHQQALRAELDDVTPRTTFATLPPDAPGADMLFQASAALAATAKALQDEDGKEDLVSRCEAEARSLFSAAQAHPGLYSDYLEDPALSYPSDDWLQYGLWASAWLYSLTSESEFKTESEYYFNQQSNKQYWSDHSWAAVYMGGTAIMFQETGESMYEDRLKFFAESHLEASSGIQHTPLGLTFVNEWGTLRHASGVAGIMAIYSRGMAAKGDTEVADEVMAFAEKQITYILGAAGHSYVVGYGCNPPQNPHHRDSALTLEESGDWNIFNTREVNANPIIGAMVGGPDLSDSWVDDRTDFKQNEVALDYNAALLFGAVQVGR